jgi:hypothetical protein
MRVFYSNPNKMRTNPDGVYPRKTPIVSEKDFHYLEVSTYNYEAGCYQSVPVRVYVVDNDTTHFTHADKAFLDQLLFAFNIDPMYRQCCGLREIGTFDYGYRQKFSASVPEIIKTIQKAFAESNLFSNIGALTYTLVKYPYDQYVDDKAAEFVKAWPGATTGDWWYNPNSGNHVQIWTLPINQDRQNEIEGDDKQEGAD